MLRSHSLSGTQLISVGTKFLALLLLLVNFCSAADPTRALPQHYRAWLKKDVVYIITNEERNAFLSLTADDARDRFIEHFWEIRNTTPGSPENPYKNEHYRRIEYATQYFGHASHTEGWRTDMGRIYITLGEPAQRQKLLGLQKITPMEIWFYSNSSRALPPFFYVVFYQRDPMDEFRLYSPFSDGPEKLITAVAGPTRQNALNILSRDAGKDVARVTLSLLPDEPVDFTSGTVSLQSDVMLSTIRNLPNNPIYREEIALRRSLLEDVTHRVVLEEEFLDLATVALRDSPGNTNLHYVLRLKQPGNFVVGDSPKGGHYYSVLASAKVNGPDGKVIFTDERKVSATVAETALDDLKGKLFGYEGWLPLPPGKYQVEFRLVNLLGKTVFHREAEIAIPEPKASSLQISSLIPFSDARMIPPQTGGVVPFGGAGVKFTPLAGQETVLVQGQALKFFYQVWTPSSTATLRTGKKLQVEYVYGMLGDPASNKTIRDEIPLNQLDAGGSVINGKQIPTVELSPGNYRLAMTLRDPESGAKTYGALNFAVNTTIAATPAWDALDDQADNGTADYRRALCYLAQGDKGMAVQWLRSAQTRNPTEERFRNKLIELYFDQQNYGKVIELYTPSGLSESTDEQTIVRIAESFEKSGNVRKAVGVMESAAHLYPASGSMLLGLAEYYRKAGEPQKAAAADQKGRELISKHPES
jgi:GWxTD domain-containing protein